MKGHDDIIAMRKAGFKPSWIWVRDREGELLDSLTVFLTKSDIPEMMDWRFTHGVAVIVEGCDPERVARIASACGKEARRVIANTYIEEVDRWGQHNFMTVSIHDTDGVLTWRH